MGKWSTKMMHDGLEQFKSCQCKLQAMLGAFIRVKVVSADIHWEKISTFLPITLQKC